MERSCGHGTAASSHSICASNTYLAPTVSLGFPHEETYSLGLPPQLTGLLATPCLRQGSWWCVRPLPALRLYQGRSLLQGYPFLPGSQLPRPPIHTHTLKGSNSTEKPPTLWLC